MKKIIIASLLAVCMASCYDEYVKDYDYTGIYFPYQMDVRTFVVGEGMKLEIGTALGGIMYNDMDRQVDFVLDNSLITPDVLESMKTAAAYIKDNVTGIDELKPIPAGYYTLSSNKMIIPKGMHGGTVVVRPDSAKFLADPATLKAQYVLPFLITRADADSVVHSKRYAVIGLRYENMLFGNYYHGGVTVVKDASGNVVNTIKYYTTIPQPDNQVWSLKTVGPDELVTSGISDETGSFRLKLAGNKITVSKAAGSTVDVLPDGESIFNQAKLLQDRKIVLKYKYANTDGTTSYAQDTLTFRNRVRDGVNEWRNEK